MIEQWKIEYDQRQYHLIIEHLEAFHSKNIDIDNLLATLKGLLNALELEDHDWLERAMNERNNLEMDYALECDRCEEAGLNLREVNNRVFEMDSAKKSILNLEYLVRERLR